MRGIAMRQIAVRAAEPFVDAREFLLAHRDRYDGRLRASSAGPRSTASTGRSTGSTPTPRATNAPRSGSCADDAPERAALVRRALRAEQPGRQRAPRAAARAAATGCC